MKYIKSRSSFINENVNQAKSIIKKKMEDYENTELIVVRKMKEENLSDYLWSELSGPVSGLYPKNSISGQPKSHQMKLYKALNHADSQTRLSWEARINEAMKKNSGVGVLIHDWSKDPLFFDNPEMRDRIFETQIQALKRLDAGESDVEVMKFFNKRSGFNYVLERFLGM